MKSHQSSNNDNQANLPHFWPIHLIRLSRILLSLAAYMWANCRVKSLDWWRYLNDKLLYEHWTREKTSSTDILSAELGKFPFLSLTFMISPSQKCSPTLISNIVVLQQKTSTNKRHLYTLWCNLEVKQTSNTQIKTKFNY